MRAGFTEALRRNRPSQKPQLWEDLGLSIRRRLTFELRRRSNPAWLDEPVTVHLSETGFGVGEAAPRLRVRPRESTNQAMFLYGVFEISETRLVQSLLRPGMVFFDVGANIGYYSVIAARLVGSAGAVHAFEPNGAVREALQQNIRLNGLTNVVVHSEAVSDRSGEVTFYESSWAANQGISSMFPGDGRIIQTTVHARTLDEIASSIAPRRIDVIKMDIEGAERLAIQGGARLFQDSAPALIFEASDLSTLSDLLGSFGYHVRKIHYSLDRGLELTATDAPGDNLFAAYEAPNYFAARDPALFDDVVARANRNRSRLFRLLGRI